MERKSCRIIHSWHIGWNNIENFLGVIISLRASATTNIFNIPDQKFAHKLNGGLSLVEGVPTTSHLSRVPHSTYCNELVELVDWMRDR
jgi:hypothetical protein